MSKTNHGRPTRDERLRLQEFDDGDPDDEVYTARGVSYTTFSYHDDEDCVRLGQADGESQSMTRREAKLKWKAPCADCVLDEPIPYCPGCGSIGGGDGVLASGQFWCPVPPEECGVVSFEVAGQ